MGDSELLKELLSFRSRQGMTRDKLAQAVALKSLAKTDDVDELATLVVSACQKIPDTKMRDSVKAAFAIDYQDEQVAGKRHTLQAVAKGYSFSEARNKARAGVGVLESILREEFLSRRRRRPIINRLVQTFNGLTIICDDFITLSSEIQSDDKDPDFLLTIEEVWDENIVFVIKNLKSESQGKAGFSIHCAVIKDSGFELEFFEVFRCELRNQPDWLFINHNLKKDFYVQIARGAEEWGHSLVDVLSNSNHRIAGSQWTYVRLYREHYQSAVWRRIFDNKTADEVEEERRQIDARVAEIMEEVEDEARENSEG